MFVRMSSRIAATQRADLLSALCGIIRRRRSMPVGPAQQVFDAAVEDAESARSTRKQSLRHRDSARLHGWTSTRGGVAPTPGGAESSRIAVGDRADER
jgi:hypothetical protein